MKLARISAVFCVIVLLAQALPARASIADDIARLERQRQQLEQERDAYQKQADQLGTQSKSLQNELAKMTARINQITKQIASLQTSISQTQLEMQQTQGQIADTAASIATHQEALARSIRITNDNDRVSLAEVVIGQNALSDFFDYLHNVELTQAFISSTVRDLQTLRYQLDEHESELRGKKSDLEQLRALTEVEQHSLSVTQGQKSTLLKETKGQESKYQQLVKQTQKSIDALKQQIFYLIQSGISAEDAVKFARLAAVGAGIRPAFLLALLEMESKLGQKLGTGNWRDDMYLCYQRLANYYPTKRAYYLKRAEDEKNAYFSIMNTLGLDPDSQKVSAEPSYGCGGAMGPAQFIPTTWLGYVGEVARLTGHNPPSPWNFQDAFTASAIKLARSGATSQDAAGETRAAKAYISGNPSCSSATCNSYASRILQNAATIEQNL